MKLTDKILEMKQDWVDFDKEVLTKLKEIHETVSVVKNEYIYDGHIIDIDVEDDKIDLEIVYEFPSYDDWDNEVVSIPLRYFDMTKEELVEEKQRLEEKNIIKMYNKKLSDLKQMREQVEQMNDQMNVLKAEIVATQEEAEELRRLSEKE